MAILRLTTDDAEVDLPLEPVEEFVCALAEKVLEMEVKLRDIDATLTLLKSELGNG